MTPHSAYWCDQVHAIWKSTNFILKLFVRKWFTELNLWACTLTLYCYAKNKKHLLDRKQLLFLLAMDTKKMMLDGKPCFFSTTSIDYNKLGYINWSKLQHNGFLERVNSAGNRRSSRSRYTCSRDSLHAVTKQPARIKIEKRLVSKTNNRKYAWKRGGRLLSLVRVFCRGDLRRHEVKLPLERWMEFFWMYERLIRLFPRNHDELMRRYSIAANDDITHSWNLSVFSPIITTYSPSRRQMVYLMGHS